MAQEKLYRLRYPLFDDTGAEMTLEEWYRAFDELLGWQPVLVEREDGFWARAHNVYPEGGFGGYEVVEGHPEFDRETWLRSPNWVKVLERSE